MYRTNTAPTESRTAPPPGAAAGELLEVQRRAGAAIDPSGRSRSEQVRIVSIGLPEVRREIPRLADRARELLSVGIRSSGDSLFTNHRENVRLRENGLRMVSLFDYGSATDSARTMLATLTGTPYYFCHGSVQMKILDRRTVLLEGPGFGADRSVVAVTDPHAVRVALRYWRSVRPGAFNAAELLRCPDDLHLTARQREVAGLMAADVPDESIARLLAVSVRTVRAEIAATMRQLGVRTRFTAGLRLGELGFAGPPAQ